MRIIIRVPKARSYGTCPSLHDRAGTFASLLYKAEKLSVCPSASWDNLSGFCMDKLGTWFVQSWGLQDVNARVSMFLKDLC